MKIITKNVWRRETFIAILMLQFIFATLIIACKPALSQELNQNCTVSVLNRTAYIQPDGTWSIPNIPSNMGQVRARVNCVENGVTWSTQSDWFTVPPNDTVFASGDLDFGQVEPIAESLEIVAAKTTLTSVGDTAQLTITATYPDNSTADVTAGSTGTSYIISNPAIATISANGLVTAVSSGKVIVSASNEMVLSSIFISVQLSGDSDGDGMPDDFELANGLNPNNPIDALEDMDRDGLTNLEEFNLGTGVNNADTDGDGIEDGEEVVEGDDGFITNPLLGDSDGDGIWDGLEISSGTDPNDSGSFDLAATLDYIEVTRSNFVLVFNTIDGEANEQLTVTGYLTDGRTIDLTSTSMGTNYSSDDITVANFGGIDGLVYAGTDGTATITVSNSGFSDTATVSVETFSPTALSYVELPSTAYANNVDITDSYAYVAGGAGGLFVVDVSNPDSPFIVTSLDTPGISIDVKVSGNNAYIADGESGLRIIDISTPGVPLELGFVDTPGIAQDLVVKDNLAFVADGESGLQIVDITDPANPNITGSVDTPGTAMGVDVEGNIAVIADGDSVQITDITDPTSPIIVGSVPVTGTVLDLVVRDSYAYIAAYSTGFQVVDFSIPTNPSVVFAPPRDISPRDVALSDQFALFAEQLFPNGVVGIYNVADPVNPIFSATMDLDSVGGFKGTCIALTQEYVYLASSFVAQDSNYGTSGSTRLIIGQYRTIKDLGTVPPSVQITSPLDGDYVGSSIQITATATDDVAVSSVNFLIDGEVVFTDSSTPYQFVYTVPIGITGFAISATAVDMANNVGLSEDVVVNVIYTTVIGQIVDKDGLPVEGAMITTNGHSYITLADGTFLIPDVSAFIIQVEATVILNDQFHGVMSNVFGAVIGGITDVGILTLINADEYDADGDGLSHSVEIALGLDPYLTDTDGDGVLDGDEDNDNDGLSNYEEVMLGTNPLERDSDGDGFDDGYESGYGSDPNDAASRPIANLYVNPIFSDGGDGTSTNPFNTIQAALDVAQDNDIIQLVDGIYTGSGNKDLSYGGKPLLVISENGTNNCIIDCEGSGRGFIFENGEDLLSILSGVTIRNGRSDKGGGIACLGASPTIQNCIIENNASVEGNDDGGGGIFIDTTSNPVIQCCTVKGNNSARYGGGIANYSGDALIYDCTITENTASWAGGGVFSDSGPGTVMIKDCTISENTATWDGGGISVSSAMTINIEGCTITGNSAVWDGGGINNYSSSELITIKNCMISDNIVAGTGGGISVYSALNTNIQDCTVTGNTALWGGGGVSDYSNGTTTIQNCTISNNSGQGSGAIAVYSTDAAIQNCVITGNSAKWSGGGITNGASNATIQNCTITNNSSDEAGGGIFNTSTVAMIKDCRIINNNSSYDGGGIYNMRSSVVAIESCVIKGNNTVNSGGGIYIVNSSAEIYNCTIVNNDSGTDGSGVYIFERFGNSSANIMNTILWANSQGQIYFDGTVNVTYSLVQGGWGGVGNLDVDPGLITDGYRLRSDSPCIDAGNLNGAPFTDIDGESRWDHPLSPNTISIFDIGADEFVDTDGDTMADIWEVKSFGDLSHDGNADSDGDGTTDKEEYDNGYDGYLPTVSITEPVNCGIDVIEGVEITIRADATDNSGIASVTFHGNGVRLADDTISPYEIDVIIPIGITIYEIEAVAEDMFGKTATVICSLGVVSDSLTTVVGEVVDPDGYTVDGAEVVVNDEVTGTTVGDGTYHISDVPAVSGQIQVEVTVMINGQMFVVRSDVFGAVLGGITDVGQLVLVSADEYDPDGDGLPYSVEVELGLDPYQADTDGDGILDGDEDLDHDGLTNREEVAFGTDLQVQDSDGDGFDDVYEAMYGSNPNDAASMPTVSLYVNPTAADGGDGTLNNPFNTIQSALDMAQSNDIIQLADGIYKGRGNKDLSYRGKPLLVISENGAESCIIDCRGSGRGFIFENSEGSLSILDGVTIQNGSNIDGGGIACIGASPTILNCTIQENNAAGNGGGIYSNDSEKITIRNCSLMNNDSGNNGGGIYNYAAVIDIENCNIVNNTATREGGGIYNRSSASVMIQDCKMLSNSSTREGGAIYNSYVTMTTIQDCMILNNSASEGGGICSDRNASVMIRNCKILNNSASEGGAISNSYVTMMTIKECTIKDNSSDRNGGGVNNSYTMMTTLQDCTVKNNSATWNGGGVYNSYTTMTTLQNCAITGNNAGVSGGGVFNYSSTAITDNCTIADNISVNSGGGIYNESSTSTTQNTIIWANTGSQIYLDGSTASVAYSLVQDGWEGEGNLDVDPLFTGSYRLKSTSPCIDAGSYGNALAADIDGESRWDHPGHINIVSTIDIGADEFVDTDGDAMADDWEMKYFGDLNHDGSFDSDGDGITDKEEYDFGYDGYLPAVSITSPADCGLNVIEGSQLTIKSEATDNSEIASVKFFANGEELFEDILSPFEVEVTIPIGISIYEIEAVAEDLFGKTNTAICSLDIIGDLLTTVTGQIVDADGLSIEGATVITNSNVSGTTLTDGTFQIPNVSTILGLIQVDATVIIDDQFFGVKSDTFAPVVGGVTDVGVLTLLNADEYDADGDGLPHSVETALGLDPDLADTDGDGILDGDEDSDHDGLTNSEEVVLGTDPQGRDSDGDGFDDGCELEYGTNPNDVNSRPSVGLYVDPTAAVGGYGTMESPFNTIQGALDAAQDYDLIQLADGLYTGSGNKDLSYGGKPLMVVSENGAEKCIIDCEGSGRGFVFENGEGPLSIINGVTIRNGNTYQGGGIYCTYTSPTIQNCIIMKNFSTGNGGGIYSYRSNSLATLTIVNCKITDNSSSSTYSFGGGIYIYDSGATIQNCTVVKNSVSRDGGGIYSYRSSPLTIVNCTITDNVISEYYRGSGVYIRSTGATIKNSILWGNMRGNLSSYQLYRTDSTLSVTYSLLQGGWSGNSNLNADPQLVLDSYRLKSNSPCIDAGSYGEVLATDIDGESRWDHPDVANAITTVDIGADEFIDIDGDSMADIWEVEHFGDLSRDGSVDSDGDGFTDKEEYDNGYDGYLPAVSITSPVDCGLDVIEGTQLTISAEATDNTGIESVTFYGNGEELSLDTSSPYEVDVTIPMGISLYEIEAVAEDLFGKTNSDICSLSIIP